jgi:hypothetical protein
MKANIGRSAFSDRCRSTAPRPPLPLKNCGNRLAERARMPATWWATLEPIGCLSSPVSWRRRPTRWTNQRCVCRSPLSHLLPAANRHARVKLHRHVRVRCRSISGNYLRGTGCKLTTPAGTRAGLPCKAQAMRNGRCYSHSGPSNRPADPGGAPAHHEGPHGSGWLLG